jgi:hypothetical protein
MMIMKKKMKEFMKVFGRMKMGDKYIYIKLYKKIKNKNKIKNIVE